MSDDIIILFQIVQRAGFPDWKTLVKRIFTDLVPDKNGDLRHKAIAEWIQITIGISENEANQLTLSLHKMDLMIRGKDIIRRCK